MAELSALERLMHARKYDGLRWRDRMSDLACLVLATTWARGDSLMYTILHLIPINFKRDCF